MLYPETRKAARRHIWKAITTGAGGSASFAIMEKGRLVYSEQFGMAERELGTPADSHTRYDVASVSKIFTSTAVLKLAEMGKIELDAPFCRYVPDFTMADERYKDITVRMMLNHSSGMMGSCYNKAFCYEPFRGYTEHVLETARYSRLKHAPGVKSSYCNDGFTLCEVLVERVSGRGYMDFLREHIIIPLGLSDTGESVGMPQIINDGMTGIPENAAELYDGATGKKDPREVSPSLGTGGISSTPEDLCRFGQSFCKNGAIRVLTDESRNEMISSPPTGFAHKLRTRQEDWHIGWDVNGMDKYEQKGVRVLMKGGLTSYSTKFIVLPDLDVSAALCFGGGGPSEAAALAILDAFLEEKGFGCMKAPAKKYPAAEKMPRELTRFAGYYSNGGTVWRCTQDSDENIRFDSLINTDNIVFRHSGGSFYYVSGALNNKDENIPYYFTEADGIMFFAAETQHSSELLFQKIPYQNEPKVLEHDINDKIWLNMNIDIDQTNWNGMFVVKSRLIKELPGYVSFGGIMLVHGANTAFPAGTYFRDQKELLLKDEDGIPTAYITDYIMRPDSTAQVIKTGRTEAVITTDRFATIWYKTEEDRMLLIEAEQGVIVNAVAPDCEKTIYRNTHQSGRFSAPKGCYIAVFGKRGGKAVIQAE